MTGKEATDNLYARLDQWNEAREALKQAKINEMSCRTAYERAMEEWALVFRIVTH